MTLIVGVDLGASNLEVIVADGDGAVRGRSDRPIPDGVDGSGLQGALLDAVLTACERAGIAPESVSAVGIASVGPIEGTAIRNPANLPAVDRLDLAGPVGARFGCDVRLVNDATAGAVAEAVAAGADDLAYVTLSTGVGVGVVAGGRPLHGHRGNAGELGHLTLDPRADLPCGCGGTGHWEAFCGGSNLVAHARSIADEGVDTDIDLETAGPETLLDASGADPLASTLADRLATWNAIGVASVVHAYDPATVVIGGGVALAHPERVVDPIRDRLATYCLHEPPPVEVAHFGADAPVRGALEFARRESGDRNR